MRNFTLIFFFLLLFLHAAAWSEEDYKCNLAGNQSQLNVCAEDDFKDTDRQLNEAYKKLQAHQTYEEQEAARKEQRAWLKERDPKCRASANSEAEGGSMWPMIFNSCRAMLTKHQTEQLRKYYSLLAIDNSKPLFGVWVSNIEKIPHTMIIRGQEIVWNPGSKNVASCKTSYYLVAESVSDTYPDNTFGVSPNRTYRVYKIKLNPNKCTGTRYLQLAIPSDAYEEGYAEVIWYSNDNRYSGYLNYSKVR